MKSCKQCGPLPDSSFATRASGYTPNVCRECERRASAVRRRQAYQGDAQERIRDQNAAWRAKNASELARKARERYSDCPRDKILRAVPLEAESWARKFGSTKDILSWAREGGYLPEPDLIQDILKRLATVSIRDPLPQLPIGLSYLDTVNSHRFMASTEGQASLHDAFYDDNAMIKVIQYILGTKREPTRELILRNLKFNIMAPAHFFPSAATALINEYAPGGLVMDPFLGWGGRVLGAMCSKAAEFFGSDLQQLSVDGAVRVASDFAILSKVSASCVCDSFASVLEQTDKRFDLILASPPFFDTENYGVEASKGCDWVVRIAKPLVSGAAKTLTSTGAVAVHAQDRPKMAVLSVLLACFLGAGFEVASEHKYGKRAGQKVLVFRKC